MRPTQAALILGLLGALALVIWLAAGAGDGRPKVAGPAPLDSLARQDPAADEPLGPPVSVPVPTLGGESGPGGERSALAPEPGAGPESLVPGGRARPIRGRVVDPLGAPIAGARVVAAGARGMALVALDQLESDEVPWVKRETGTSAEDGSFELASIAGDTLRLAVRAPGFAPLRTERALSGPERDQLGELVLERGVVLSGRVVDAAGRAVSGAELHPLAVDAPGRVFLVHGARGSLLGTTDDAGRFELDEIAAGPFRLAVRHPDHPDALEEGQTDAPGEVRSGLLIRLEEGFSIAGRVLGVSAGSASEYSVRARPLEEDAGFDAERKAALEADGAFKLRGLRGGREYVLKLIEAGAGPFGSDRSAAVVARPGQTDVTLELVEGLAVVGRVVDATTEEPIERFVVEAGTAWLSPETDPAGQTVEDHPGGSFRYEHVETLADQQPLSVRVRAEGYATYSVKDVPIPGDRVVELGSIRLEPVPYVVVHVLDAADERAVPGARVTLSEAPLADPGRAAPALPADELEDARQALADGNGTARVPSLPGRRCTLRVVHPDFAPFTSDPIELPASGGAEHRVRLVKGGAVEVLVVDRAGNPAAGVAVTRRGPERGVADFADFARGVESDAQGTVRFAHLVAGTHAFRIDEGGARTEYFARPGEERGSRAGWVDVQVGEGTRDRITIELPPLGTLRGRVTEAGKALPGATLVLEEPGLPPAGAFGRGGAPRATSDGRGAFTLEAVRAGTWTLRVSHAARAMDALLPVTIVEGDNELEVTLDLAVVEGRVTDEEGGPVVGATLRVFRAASAGSGGEGRAPAIALEGQRVSIQSATGAQLSTDEDGRYQLRGLVTGVELVVEARAEGCQPGRSEQLELRSGETRSGVDLQLAYGGRVEVEVFDREGAPAGFVLVSAEYTGADADRAEDQSEFVQEGGRTSFQGLVPGPWLFTARSVAFGGEGNTDLRAEPVRVDVVSRETHRARLDLR